MIPRARRRSSRRIRGGGATPQTLNPSVLFTNPKPSTLNRKPSELNFRSQILHPNGDPLKQVDHFFPVEEGVMVIADPGRYILTPKCICPRP